MEGTVGSGSLIGSGGATGAGSGGGDVEDWAFSVDQFPSGAFRTLVPSGNFLSLMAFFNADGATPFICFPLG